MAKVRHTRGMSKATRKDRNYVSRLSLKTMRNIEKATEALEKMAGMEVSLESRTKDKPIVPHLGDVGKYTKRKLNYDEKIKAKTEARNNRPSFVSGMDRLLGKKTDGGL